MLMDITPTTSAQTATPSSFSSTINDGGEVLPWNTCGGIGYEGPTNCTKGYLCVRISQWFSQCYSTPSIGGKTCISGGQPNTDVAGIGVLVVLTFQSSLAMILALCAGKQKNLATRDYTIKVLLVTTDVQVLNGMALTFSAIVHWRRADLYHLRLIFDTISLAGVSIWPAMLINSLKRQNPSRGRQSSDNGPRIFAVTTFVILYFIFAVLLGIRLQGWDANSAGGCYESGVMTIEYLKHPVPDLTYLGITAPVLIIAILGSTLSAAHAEDFWHNGILFIAVLEASFHFFSIIVHRATKQNFLVSDQSDNEFGFGQIMVMVLLLSIPFECYKSFQERDAGRPSCVLAPTAGSPPTISENVTESA